MKEEVVLLGEPARAGIRSIMPYSVVPTTPTSPTVALSIRASAAAGSMRRSTPSGAVRISRPSIRQAFSNEKCDEAGTTTFGLSTGRRAFAIRRAWMFDSVPPDDAYPAAPGRW